MITKSVSDKISYRDTRGFWDKHGLFFFSHICNILVIQDGRGSVPFTETAYRVKYFKSIPKEINQDASTVWT